MKHKEGKESEGGSKKRKEVGNDNSDPSPRLVYVQTDVTESDYNKSLFIMNR